MNREDFIEVFAQNAHIIGGNARIFAALVYSGAVNSSLVPATGNSKLLTVPVGQGFRIALSRYDKLLTRYTGRLDARNVRATRKSFIRLIEVGRSLGFKLSDITLSRGSSELVAVRSDSTISEETYKKYSEDPLIVPTYLGFSNGESVVTFDIDMKITCINYQPECSYLIFDAVSGILEEEQVYRSLEAAFIPKKDETWVSSVTPVHVSCAFKDRESLISYLESSFSGAIYPAVSGKNSISFSSDNGVWGELLLSTEGVDIYFKSGVDFALGIRLMDTLGMVMPE